MTGREIFKIWAPFDKKWIDWVRPVPFVSINKNDFELYDVTEFVIPKINYVENVRMNIAIFVDLPENDSIKEGIALAKLGFRPIPIYNGTSEQKGAIPTVDNHKIELGLIKGALELKKMEIKEDAPPVFLLDSNRMNRYKMDLSVFDNSWDIYEQDVPTADYFIKNGIEEIVVRGNGKINKDLHKILYRFQKKGMKIFWINEFEEIKYIKLKKIKYKN